MAKAKQGPQVADLLAQIEIKHQQGPKSHVRSALEELAGTPLGEAFEAALRDAKNYSCEAIERFMRSHGHKIGQQSIGKWRRDNGIRT